MFETGRVYVRRSEIHGRYKGQQQGGISTPTSVPAIFLFTGESGAEYGYEDKFLPSGLYRYTGEGQVGDMTWVRGNSAIRDHQSAGKSLHLFEEAGPAKVRYVGEATYVGHHLEELPDRNGDLRQAIVFDLAVETEAPPGVAIVREGPPADRLWSRPLDEVRRLAQQRADPGVSRGERRRITHARSKAVRVYVLRRANGICENCELPAPFKTKKRRPYLEPHHLTRLADGGPDDPDAVAAICPNCHREIHYGVRGDELNARLADKIRELEHGPRESA